MVGWKIPYGSFKHGSIIIVESTMKQKWCTIDSIVSIEFCLCYAHHNVWHITPERSMKDNTFGPNGVHLRGIPL